MTIELQIGEEPVTIETVDGALRTRRGPAADPDLVLNGPPELVLGLLSERLSLAEARARGLSCSGDVAKLRRLRARPEAAVAG